MNGIPTAKEFFGKGGKGENFIPGIIMNLDAFLEGYNAGQKLVPMDQVDENGKLIISGELIDDKKYLTALQNGYNKPCEKLVADSRKNNFFCMANRTLEASMFLSQAFMDSLNKTEQPEDTLEEKGRKILIDTAKAQQELHCKTKPESLDGKDVSNLTAKEQLNYLLGHAANCIEAFRMSAKITQVNFQPTAMNYIITVHNCLKEGIATDNFTCRSITPNP